MPDIESILSQAGQALAKGAHDRAAEQYRQILEHNPDHPVANFQLGVILAARRQFQEAVAFFALARKGLMHLSPAHHNYAVCLRRLDRHEEAASALRQALILDPTAQGAMTGLAESIAHLGDPKYGVEIARRSIMLDPSAADPRAALGQLQWRAANWSAAIAEFEAQTRRRPTDPTAWHNLAISFQKADRLAEAAKAFSHNARLIHGRPVNHVQSDPHPALPAAPVAPADRVTCWHRLKHDRDQLIHLVAIGRLPESWRGQIDAYQTILNGLSAEERAAISFRLSDQRYELIEQSYNRCIFREDSNWPQNRPALSDKVDWSAHQATYLAGEPKAVVIDDFLTPEALAALRRFCRNSSIWFETKGAGYLGAYFRAGFNDTLLVRIAEEMRERLPEILAPHTLETMWAYSYEQSMVGINPHADFAAVNINFWITEDDANLDPATGGLVVYPKAAPPDWGFEDYNHASSERIYDYLGEARERSLKVPNRANRMLMFDSRLFHETDIYKFAPGFTNRRINLTMLYGQGA